MKAIKKPVKIDCWLITQDELNDIWMGKILKMKILAVCLLWKGRFYNILMKKY